MGLFVFVNYTCICPVCYSKLNGFQTKVSKCLLTPLNPHDVDNFYTYCTKCGCSIEFYKDSKTKKFERIVKSSKKGKLITLKEFTKLVKIKEK